MGLVHFVIYIMTIVIVTISTIFLVFFSLSYRSQLPTKSGIKFRYYHQKWKQKNNPPKSPFIKRILVVDDDPDLTLTFKAGLDGYYYGDGDKKRFEVYTYNDPLLVLTEFKPHYYDILLTDIYMPNMNGFQLCKKLLELDVNIRVCFISALEVNIKR